VEGPVDVDDSGLLDDFIGPARQERRELIEWLLERGFDIGQIRSAFSPMLLPANRIIGEDGTLVSPREVAESNGVDLDLLQRLQRAVGLPRVENPDAQVQPRADAESVLSAARLVELGIHPDHIVVIAQLLMEGFSRTAVMLRRAALKTLLRPGATELELAQAMEALVKEGTPMLDPMIGDLLRLALRHSLETEAINAAERAAGVLPGARQVAVAFGDVVGFTRLGEALSPEDLGLLARRLSDLTREVVAHPVQFVKTIGDAVMLVCTDPKRLLMTVLDLVEAADAAAFPSIRVGVAFGPAISRTGDWYGNSVNLASRVTDEAPPGTVLVDESARNVIDDAELEWTFHDQRHLKGIRSEVRLYRATRAATEHIS
jgi:adenylate cyclase